MNGRMLLKPVFNLKDCLTFHTLSCGPGQNKKAKAVLFKLVFRTEKLLHEYYYACEWDSNTGR